MFTNEQVQRRLLLALLAYEVTVIGVTMWAGASIAIHGGGSLAMAAPLLLIAAAESLRIFVAAWAARVTFFPKILALLVLAAISIASFEGLSVAFEQFITNRVKTISDLQRDVRAQQVRLDAAKSTHEIAKQNVERLDAAIQEAVSKTPQQPALSGKTCASKRGYVTCTSDVIAQRNFVTTSKSHQADLEQLRSQRVAAQQAANQSTPSTQMVNAAADAQDKLSLELSQSPMHRLAATWFGVSVESLTMAQFETVRRVAIGGLAGSLAVLSMLVSVVAHAQPAGKSDGKLTRSIRAYLARRRKPLVKTVKIAVPSGVRLIHKYLPIHAEPPTRKGPLGKFEYQAEPIRTYREMF
jgi:hypothetical protein